MCGKFARHNWILSIVYLRRRGLAFEYVKEWADHKGASKMTFGTLTHPIDSIKNMNQDFKINIKHLFHEIQFFHTKLIHFWISFD